jgi:hypothetical protein
MTLKLIDEVIAELEMLEPDDANLERSISSQLDVLRGAKFLLHCLERMQESVSNDTAKEGAHQFSDTKTCFLIRVVTLCAVLGIPLKLRSIHLPPASVIERLNSLLEDPRSLALAEDIQQFFAKKVAPNSGRSSSLPIASGFCIAATTTEAGLASISAPLRSRFTVLHVHRYEMQVMHLLDGGIRDDASVIAGGQFEVAESPTMRPLLEATTEIRDRLGEWGVQVSITEFVRWCSTSRALFEANIAPRRAVGIAVLRTVLDSLESPDRLKISEYVHSHSPDFLPKDLVELVRCEGHSDGLAADCPIAFRFPDCFESLVSGINISGIVGPEPDALQSAALQWIPSARSIAEVVFTAIAATACAGVEGSGVGCRFPPDVRWHSSIVRGGSVAAAPGRAQFRDAGCTKAHYQVTMVDYGA